MKGLLPLLLAAAGFSVLAYATEYRTVDAVAVLYDAPSHRGRKLFVIRRGTPVEVVVSIEGWTKVRDAEGDLAWIEEKYLSKTRPFMFHLHQDRMVSELRIYNEVVAKRSVIVTVDRAQVRQKAEEGSPLIFEAERNVLLEYLEAVPDSGWIRVRHSDGESGFVRGNQVWGW